MKKDLGIILGLLWTAVAYVTGHVVANISSYLLSKRMVRGVLRSPEETLFQEENVTAWARVFPGFYEPLPKETQERILLKAKGNALLNFNEKGA